MTGTVQKMTAHSIFIKSTDGEEYRDMLAKSIDHDVTKLIRVIVIGAKEERGGDAKDATGYPVKAGDKITYMAKAFANTCQTFKIGNVTQIADDTAYFEYSKPYVSGKELAKGRRRLNRIVVI